MCGELSNTVLKIRTRGQHAQCTDIRYLEPPDIFLSNITRREVP